MQADVAAVREHDSQKQAHVLGVTSSALSGGQEVVGEAQVVVDLDEQVWQPGRAHSLGQPSFQAVEPCLRLGVQLLGSVDG